MNCLEFFENIINSINNYNLVNAVNFINMLNEVLFVTFLAFMGIYDFIKKKIPLLPCVGIFVITIILNLLGGKNFYFMLAGLSVSIIIYICSLVTRQGIGKGDALVYAVIGVKVGVLTSIEILIYSLILSSLIGIFLILIFKKSRKYKIAFIPFTALSYGVILCLEKFLLKS